jgi:hypothetical protein
MSTVWRISLSLLCGLCGFVVAFLLGFYLSFLFGANIHDALPGVFGLGFGVVGGTVSFEAARNRLPKPPKTFRIRRLGRHLF